MDQGRQTGRALGAIVVSPFRATEVRLQLSLLACNLGNLWRRLVVPRRIDSWSSARPAGCYNPGFRRQKF
jgi:hypothetical protein